MASKIYTRETQSKGTVKKPKDEKARKRNTIINFRVSPEEKARIDARIAMTGMDKAEFFTGIRKDRRKLTCRLDMVIWVGIQSGDAQQYYPCPIAVNDNPLGHPDHYYRGLLRRDNDFAVLVVQMVCSKAEGAPAFVAHPDDPEWRQYSVYVF